MNNIIITDVYNNILKYNEINNKLPFVIVHSSQPNLIIERVGTVYNNSSIWKLITPILIHIMCKYKINPLNYSSLGHIWLHENKLPNKISILLVNNNSDISEYPKDFKKIIKYNGMYIWKPICKQKYLGIGYILSKTKPSCNEMKTINSKFLKKYNGKNYNDGKCTNMNEYNLLSYVGNTKYTINKFNGVNYKTHIKNKSDVAKINYTAQGELKNDKIYITASTNDNMEDNYAYLTKCNDDVIWKSCNLATYTPMIDINTNYIPIESKIEEFTMTPRKTHTKNKTVTQYNKQHNTKNWTSTGNFVVLKPAKTPWFSSIKNSSETESSIDTNMTDNIQNHINIYKTKIVSYIDTPKKKFQIILCILVLLIILIICTRLYLSRKNKIS